MSTILGKLIVWGKGLAEAKRYKKLLKQLRPGLCLSLLLKREGRGDVCPELKRIQNDAIDYLIKARISGISKKSSLINCIVDGKKKLKASSRVRVVGFSRSIQICFVKSASVAMHESIYDSSACKNCYIFQEIKFQGSKC